MSRVFSLRLADEDASKLDRWARRYGRTAGSAAGVLLSEKLKEESFPDIEHRSTAAGRLAYIKGTRLPVWLVVNLCRAAGLDAAAYAESLGWIAPGKIQAAFDYAQAFPAEVQAAIDYADEYEARHNPHRAS